MLYRRNMGMYQGNRLSPNLPGDICPHPIKNRKKKKRCEISAHDLIYINKKIKLQMGNDWSTFHPSSSPARKQNLEDTVHGSHLFLSVLLQEDVLEELPTLCVGGLVVEHASLNDFLIHVQLVAGCCLDSLLHTVHSHEAQHTHLVLLADAVSAILGLQVLINKTENCDLKECSALIISA